MPGNTLEKRLHNELRLFVTPLCGGLVYAAVKVMVYGFSDAVLFSGFLFGCILSAVLGIPFLLLGDRRCPESRLRHVLSGLIQSLMVSLSYRGPLWQLLLISIVGGVALGGLYTLALGAIEKIPASNQDGATRGWGAIVAIPLSGGLSLGTVAVIATISQSSGLLSIVSMFFMLFLIGGLISMLVSWPMLWLVERFLTTRLRYLIGGVTSSFFVWLLSVAPVLLAKPQALLKGAELSPRGFWPGLIVYLVIGLVAGAVYTVIIGFLDRRRRRNDSRRKPASY